MNNNFNKLLNVYKKDGLKSIFIKIYRYFKGRNLHDISRFKFVNIKNIKEDIEEKYNFNGDLVNIFSNNKNNIVHKWHHYLPVYDRYLNNYRNKTVRILEIGVSKGGSLQMWREYFGKDAIIFGIDINPECKIFNNATAQVRIGSQGDSQFLLSVIKEMGGVDIIIDDGSHTMDHISKSLKILFPVLNFSGLYIIEDLHAAYWEAFGGGYKSSNNFYNTIRAIIDDMHHWYHGQKIRLKEIGNNCSSIHIYDSIVVLEKNINFMPVHSEVK